MKDILAKLSDDELKDLKTKLTNQADSMPKLYKLIYEEVLRRSLKGDKDD